MGDEKEDAGIHKGVRLMVEGTAATPFFRRHSGHVPAEIKLYAEVDEEDDYVVLKTAVGGYDDDMIKVDATENTIEVVLHSGKSPKDVDGEKNHEDDVALRSSYWTPSVIDPDRVTVLRKGDTLVVKAEKKR